MTTEPTLSPNAARLERTYDAQAELIWELWTTAAGLAEWFAPDGFESRVSELELRPGGQLRFIMTATAPEQVDNLEALPGSRRHCDHRGPRGHSDAQAKRHHRPPDLITKAFFIAKD